MVPLSTVEFVDRTIAGEVKRLEEVFKAQLDARDKAHDIQAKELSRRLDELNHEHRRTIEDRNQYLTKATYEVFLKDYYSWRDETNRFLSTAQGRSAAYVFAVGIGFVLLQIAMRFWGK